LCQPGPECGDAHDPVAGVQSHDDHAAGSGRIAVDGVRLGPDHLAPGADEKQLLVLLRDLLDGRHVARLPALEGDEADALAAAVHGPEFRQRHALAVAGLGQDEQVGRRLDDAHAHDTVRWAGQADADDAGGGAAHRPDLVLWEAGDLALSAGDDDVVGAGGHVHPGEFVVRGDGDGDDAGTADLLELLERGLLDDAVARGEEDNRFVLEADIWSAMNLKVCYLEEQYRQEDKNFFKILNSLRSRQDLEKVRKSLLVRMDKEIKSEIKPTKLYTHNLDVDAYNIRELNKLKGESIVYEMRYHGLKSLTDKLKAGCLAPERLELKIDAVVMFVKNNFKEGYVNGTLGKVVGFETENNYPIIKTFKGELIGAHNEVWQVEDSSGPIASLTQLPLRLAWAITIHKSQGMSLDCAEIDLSKTFEYGMGYVALSRVRSLAGCGAFAAHGFC